MINVVLPSEIYELIKDLADALKGALKTKWQQFCYMFSFKSKEFNSSANPLYL